MYGDFQGSFISTGLDVFIQSTSGIDWIEVLNDTNVAAGAGANRKFKFTHQKPMPVANTYVEGYSAGAVLVPTIDTTNMFRYVDTTEDLLLPPVDIEEIDNSPNNHPRVHAVVAGDVANLVAGQTIVRLYFQTDAAAPPLLARQLIGIDFTVGVVDVGAGTFELLNALPIVATNNPIVSYYRVVVYQSIFAPRNSVVTNVIPDIAQPMYTRVYTAVTQNWKVGQQIRFRFTGKVRPNIVAANAYNQPTLQNVTANIIEADLTDANGAKYFLTDVDTSLLPAFQFPETAFSPFTPMQVTPVGLDLAVALNAIPQASALNAAVMNTAQKGILLSGGANRPGGAAGDRVFWRYSKSWNL